MRSTSKKAASPVARPTSTAKKAAAPSTAKRIARSAATGKLADRVIYHSPLEPRHLTRSQIKAIVAKDRP